jgi:hypothetical protein
MLLARPLHGFISRNNIGRQLYGNERLSRGSAFMGIPVINFKLLAKRLQQIVDEIRDFLQPDRNMDHSWRNPRMQQFVVARAVVRSVGRPKN